MFKKSRRKIVDAIMSILALVFLGTLAIIYLSSYGEVAATNREMLTRYAELYSLEDQPGVDGIGIDPLPDIGLDPIIDGPDEPEGPGFENTPTFQLATFYSVAIADGGTVIAVDTGSEGLYDETTLKEYAAEILSSGRVSGTRSNLLYLKAEKNGYTLVAFMDNTVIQESMTTLFRYTLVFGGIALLVLFFVAVQLAKRIVKPLEESYQRQKQFISDAGHELKTPVAVIDANAELLAREIGDNQWLANIQHENARMSTLVIQLLNLAKTENVTPQMETVDLSRVIMGEVLPFESVAFEHGLTLRAEIPESVMVIGNPGQLSQLTSILLDNAIRHSQPGGTVEVNIKQERSMVRFSVVNEGAPIPAEQQKQLFERFYRADEARTDSDNHYGLGLAIAKAIVTGHKGTIGVNCKNGLVEFWALIPGL